MLDLALFCGPVSAKTEAWDLWGKILATLT